jgi:hypothetical protein
MTCAACAKPSSPPRLSPLRSRPTLVEHSLHIEAIEMRRTIFLAMLITSFPALAGELVQCEPQPVTGDGQEWYYRTKVGGRPEKCFYIGQRMKPRNELYWEQSSLSAAIAPSESGQGASGLVPAPAFENRWPAEGSLADRWEGIGTWAWK